MAQLEGVPADDVHPWFQGDEEARLRLQGLIRQRITEGQWAISWEALAQLDEVDRARQFIPVDSPWDRLFSMCYTDSYREVMLGFLMTFRFVPIDADPLGDGEVDERPEVFFTLMGQAFAMSLRQFAVHTGLYTEEETHQPIYTEAIHERDMAQLERFWLLITGRVREVGEDRRASDIIDPLHRYIHMVIARSITGRHRGREHVTDADLFYLYCIIWRREHCHLARCLAQFFASAYHRRSQSRLYGGAFITALGARLGVDPAGHPFVSPPLRPSRIGMPSIRSMAPLVSIDGHQRWSDGQGHRFQPIPFPPELPQFPGGPAEPAPDADPHQPPQADADLPDQPAEHQIPPPPQHPQHVYREVVLSASIQAQIDGLVRDVQASQAQIDGLVRDVQASHAQIQASQAQIQASQAQIQHLTALVRWLVDLEVVRAHAQGLDVPDVPAPPAPQQGPPHHQEGAGPAHQEGDGPHQ